jgi:hypothetical protein
MVAWVWSFTILPTLGASCAGAPQTCKDLQMNNEMQQSTIGKASKYGCQKISISMYIIVYQAW